MRSFSTRTVLSGGVPLACREYAGPGPDLVLMHGAGMSQASLTALIDNLDGLRVLTFDFRGHGDTPMSTWTMETAVSDLEAVLAAYGLRSSAVAGHSLGGMVAVEYARRHPDCPAAINIDGHGMGVPEQYVGKDAVLVSAWMRERKATAARLTQGVPMRAARLLARLTGRHPADPAALAAVTAIVDDLDLIQVYREVQGPLMVFNAYAPQSGVAGRLMKDPDGYARAYRIGISRDVRELAASGADVELVEMDATHMLIRTHPEQTADRINDFLRRSSDSRPHC